MNKAEKAMLREEYSKAWSTEKLINHCTNNAAAYAVLTKGEIYVVDKAEIETRFCFGYSDSAYDTKDFDRAENMASYASKSEEYFVKKNLDSAGYDRKISWLKSSRYIWYTLPNYTRQDEDCRLVCCNKQEAYNKELPKGSRLLTEADKDAIIEALTEAKKLFIKRLNAYLKRYGLSKIKTWSYWRDA